MVRLCGCGWVPCRCEHFGVGLPECCTVWVGLALGFLSVTGRLSGWLDPVTAWLPLWDKGLSGF